MGLKSFQTAEVVIGGMELAEKIKKGQFKMGKLGGGKAIDAGDLASRSGRVIGIVIDRCNDSGRICRNSQFAPEPVIGQS